MKKKQYKTPLTGIVSSANIMKISLLGVSGHEIDNSSGSPSISGITGDEDEWNGDFD